MIVTLDQAMEATATLANVSVSFQALSGSPSLEPGYPVTNLYDGTSAAYRLTRECRIEMSAGDVAAIQFDLGYDRLIDYVAVVGLSEGMAGTWAASEWYALAKVELYWSDNGTGWALLDSVSNQAAAGLRTLSGPALWLSGGGAWARYWRVSFEAVGQATVRLGYIHLGRAIAEVVPERLGWQVVPSAVVHQTERGNVVSIDGPDRRHIQVAGMLPAFDRVADFERFRSFYRLRWPTLLNPVTVPCLALYPDEVGVATPEARIAAQHMPTMVTIDPTGWSVEGTGAPGWYPTVAMTFAEWV